MIDFNLSLHEIENMLPWEREVYITLLKDYIKRKEEAIDRQRNI